MNKQNLPALSAFVLALSLSAMASVSSAQEVQVAPNPPASQPGVAPAATVPVATAPAATVPAATPTNAAEPAVVKLPPVTVTERVDNIDFSGRTLVVRNGEEYYCKKERVTGSKLKSRTSCLTREQLEEMNLQARRNVNHMNTRLSDSSQTGNNIAGGTSKTPYGVYR